MNPVLVFQVITNLMACWISDSQSAGDQVDTPLGPQKCPLKWVPISWPSRQAKSSCRMVRWMDSSLR